MKNCKAHILRSTPTSIITRFFFFFFLSIDLWKAYYKDTTIVFISTKQCSPLQILELHQFAQIVLNYFSLGLNGKCPAGVQDVGAFEAAGF